MCFAAGLLDETGSTGARWTVEVMRGPGVEEGNPVSLRYCICSEAGR